MIKVLQVVSSLNINAGMMSVIMNYYRRFDRSRIQFDFLYFAEMEKSHEAEILSLGGKTYFLGNASFNKDYKEKLKKFFKEHEGEYTAVHCHPIWAAALVGGIAKKSGVKHVISHSHSTKYSEKPISAIRNRLMMPVILKSSTELIACSGDAKELFGKRKDVFVLHNAIDIKRFIYNSENREKIRKEFSVKNDETLICHVGRFSVEKNHSFMISTFKELLKDLPTAKLLLVGDGVLFKQTKTIASDLSVSDRVFFTGKRYDIPEILSAADVFILPSLFEGVPLSIIEAQASGLPCVLSSTITKEVDFGSCIYADINNPSEWIKAVCDMSEINDDRQEKGKKLLGGSYDIDAETENLFKYYLKFSD